jgi:hypothetical protein
MRKDIRFASYRHLGKVTLLKKATIRVISIAMLPSGVGRFRDIPSEV